MPTILDLLLNLQHPSFTRLRAGETFNDCDDRAIARALRLAADRIEADGVCPGGVHGGILPGEIGYWVVRSGAVKT